MAWLALAVLPFAAAAACSGHYADMQSYAGKSLYATHFLDTPLVAARLKRLPVELRLHLRRNLGVSGPLKLIDCHLVVSGSLPHRGTEEDAILDADLATGTVTAAIHSGGRIDIYVIRDPAAGTPDASWNELPRVVREWAVKADSGFALQQPRSLAQPASVRLHVPTGPPPVTETASATARKIDFGKDAIKPTAAQAAAIRRAAGDGLGDCDPAHQNCYAMVLADLNDDGRPDLLVQYAYATGYCGSAGCGGIIVMATPHGYASKAINLAIFYGKIDILNGKHHGMHDLRYNGDSPVWKWTGKAYDIGKAGQPGAGAPPWQTRQVAGRPMLALATPIDSTIKTLVVFCEQRKPLLAMVTKTPRPAGPVTLTFVFRGWTVNVPMSQGNRGATLWMADLSRSELPLWLAHRGTSAARRDLARRASNAFLRINGRMEGQLSLQNSTATTQAALESCYRY